MRAGEPHTGPKLAVSACTTYHTTFDEDIENYRSTGIDGVGLWEYKLAGGDIDGQLARFRESGLTATFCFPNTPGIIAGDHLFSTPKEPSTRLRLLCDSIRRLASLKPAAIVCLAGPADSGTTRDEVVSALREAAAVAADCDVRLALEVIRHGAHESLVPTIGAASRMIEEIGADNMGILLDTWHVSEHPDVLEEIAEHTHQVVGIQLCDRSPGCRGWFDRSMPGTGVLPVVEVVRAAHEAGFDGWFEVEIFSDDGTFGDDYEDSLWKRPAKDVLQAATASFDDVWQRASEPA